MAHLRDGRQTESWRLGGCAREIDSVPWICNHTTVGEPPSTPPRHSSGDKWISALLIPLITQMLLITTR